jgi:hypothetical protein
MRKNLFCLLITGISFSAAGMDFQSPRVTSLGGAGRAGPILNDTIYQNPSYVSFLPSYSFSGNYGTQSTDQPDTANSGSTTYNASVIDGSSENFFQAGVGYTNRLTGHLLTIGASKSFLAKYGIGIGGKFFWAPNQTLIRDMTIGSTVVLNKWLQLAIVMDNVIEGDEARAAGFERYLSVATKVNLFDLGMVYIDPRLNLSQSQTDRYGAEVGAEAIFFSDFFLRGGLFYNSRPPHFARFGRGYSLGAGWSAPKISIDYAFSHMVSANDNLEQQAMAHVFGTTIYF